MTREEVLQALSMGEELSDIHGSNVDKLVEVLLDKGVQAANFGWMAGAAALTPDERAAEVLKYQAQIEEYNSLPDETKMRLQIRDTFIALYRGMLETAVDYSKVTEVELKQRLINLLTIIDHELLTLRNWVDQEEIDNIISSLGPSGGVRRRQP